MKNPKITTIIPTFRRPILLKKAIESVLNQTYPHFQVCIYDNASKDETEEVVRGYMKQDSRIIYHQHPMNIGMMKNYSYALSRIQTPFFSLLSDDDYFLPHFYETALEGFEHFPNIAFSACGVRVQDEEDRFVSDPLMVWTREGYFKPQEALFEMISKPLLPIGVVFRYDLVKEIAPDLSEEIQIRWDTDYLLQIAAQHFSFINRKTCAIFLFHAEGYSTGSYREMETSVAVFQKHLSATEIIKNRLLINPHLSSTSKEQVAAEFDFRIRKDFLYRIKVYLSRIKVFEILKIIKLMKKDGLLDMQTLRLVRKECAKICLQIVVLIKRAIIQFFIRCAIMIVKLYKSGSKE